MQVSCSWLASADLATAVLLRDDAAHHDAAPPPLNALLTLEPSDAVTLPRAMALRRLVVLSSARTLELHTAAPGSAGAWQYVASARGVADDDAGFCVDHAAEPDCVCDALKLRLLSLRPPGRLTLRGVVLDAVPATLAPPAAPMATLMSAMQAGGAAPPTLLGMLGALAGGARPAGAQPPAELVHALRSVAAAPEVAAAAARVEALEVAVGEAGPGAAGPQAAPLAALELRIARLEQLVERGLADLAARVLRLEQEARGAERPP